ncbi:MAG TPA: hypothetical protein VMW16_08925 [Sedimentisphaerales bacterium]|nr:hypothetical protein [Sedimentisphaerales bacterium]
MREFLAFTGFLGDEYVVLAAEGPPRGWRASTENTEGWRQIPDAALVSRRE